MKNKIIKIILLLTSMIGLNAKTTSNLVSDLGNVSDLSANQIAWREAIKSGDLNTKIRISQSIGEKSAVRWAKSKGFEILKNPLTEDWGPGNDLVAKCAKSGKIYAIEIKGGDAKPESYRGFKQGTHAYAVECAKSDLKINSKCPPNIKETSKQVLNAASSGNLETCVLQQKHIHGKIIEKPIISFGTDYIKGRGIAKKALNDLHSQSAINISKTNTKTLKFKSSSVALSKQKVHVKSVSSSSGIASGLTKSLTRAAPIVGAGIEIYHRGSEIMNTEKNYSSGRINSNERKIRHIETGVSSASGLTGAYILGMQSAAIGTFIGPIGTISCGIIGGAAGYFLGDQGSKIILRKLF